MTLVLYADEGEEPATEIALHPRHNRTGDHWHILVSGLPTVFRYGWRVDGPSGIMHRFNPELILLDPASTALSGGAIWGVEPNGSVVDRASRTASPRQVS